MVTGAIYTATHEYRKAFWFPLGLILLGVLVLLNVDVNKGKDEARKFARDKREKYSLAAMQSLTSS